MSAVAEKPVDREGLPVTCTNLDALPVYNEMLLVNMAVRESALSQVQSVLELDQGFILAHCILVSQSLHPLVNYLIFLIARGACGCPNLSQLLIQKVLGNLYAASEVLATLSH